MNEQKRDKGYHIKDFPEEARRLAKAGAILEGVSVGEWIAGAVRDRWQRKNPKRRPAKRIAPAPTRTGPEQPQEKVNA